MQKTILCLFLAGLTSFSLQAQDCNPSIAPTGLTSSYTPGTGALLQWDAVPGSVWVQLRVDLPTGSTINRRIIGEEVDQFLIPDALLSPGTYTWWVQAACTTVPPFVVTPISASNNFTIGGGSSCPATVMDIDGNVYNTVEIGSQCWTKSNLKVERYRNGDVIATGLSASDWETTSGGAYAVYAGKPANKLTYGLLYNWYSVNDARGLCPLGWHVPTDEEWTTMITVLDPSTCGSCLGSGHSLIAGGQMKTTGTLSAGTGLWKDPNTDATNSSGFSARPGGYRNANGNWYGKGLFGFWWSSSEVAVDLAWLRYVSWNFGEAFRGDSNQHLGASVRCLKD